jgi:hypothetical protein
VCARARALACVPKNNNCDAEASMRIAGVELFTGNVAIFPDHLSVRKCIGLVTQIYIDLV